ncbi:CLUMA_CG001157, isoform A [Clunio marinus]|uniref:CLUMA_CG001157, isoform A n=1 Tax=Clunio marinus TaxID=568069 RepID=A0A1J1HHJ5_9DIPT|nr:CLUMA_CG001157, isoform A [Clunio marinus]
MHHINGGNFIECLTAQQFRDPTTEINENECRLHKLKATVSSETKRRYMEKVKLTKSIYKAVDIPIKKIINLCFSFICFNAHSHEENK